MSAIYIPQGDDTVDAELVELLEQPPLSTLLHSLKSAPQDLTPALFRSVLPIPLKAYSDSQLEAAIETALAEKPTHEAEVAGDLMRETDFRNEEYRVIRESQEQAELLARRADLRSSPYLRSFFSNITLLHKLRETRVLTGFSRLTPGESSDDPREALRRKRALMWKDVPAWSQRWLPAVNVYGEGIFLEFDLDRLRRWESREDVQDRIFALHQRNRNLSEGYQRRDPVSPRLVLLHTVAHLLITQLTFSSGYSAASLRERLYVAHEDGKDMAGILIYTAAGDAEGTLGGLVRLGKPERLEEILREALEAAKWCSSDPVCMEAGEGAGQGLGALNLAACHSCALLPETSCEEFNRFLDRGVVVGSLESEALGYFCES